MDPYAQGGMIFTVVMTLIIGGFVVTAPVIRRLGGLIEEMIRDRQQARLGRENNAQIAGDVEDLRQTLGRIEGHLDLLAERQDFVENLLGHREQKQLPQNEEWQG